MSEQHAIDNAANLIRRAGELSETDEVEVLLVIGNNNNYFILNTFDQAVPLASILQRPQSRVHPIVPSKHNGLRRLQGNVAPSPVRPVRSLQILPDKAQAREFTATPTVSNAPRSHPAPLSCTLMEACILDEPGRRISPVIVDDLRTPTKNPCRLRSKVVQTQPPKGVRSQAVDKDKGKLEPQYPTPPSSLAVTVEESDEQPSKHGYVKEVSIFNNDRPKDAWTVGVANQLRSGSDALNDKSGLPDRLHGEHETNSRYNQHTLHCGGRPGSIGRARNVVHSAAMTYKRQTTQPSDRPSRSLSNDRIDLDLYKDRADRPFILESGRKDKDILPLGGQGSRQSVKPGGSTSYQSKKGVSTYGRADEPLPFRPTTDITGQSGTQASNRMRDSEADNITETISDPPSAYFSDPENTLQPGAVPEGAVPHGGSQDENSNFPKRYMVNFTKEATSKTTPVQSRPKPEPTIQVADPQPPTIQNEPRPHDTIREAPTAKSTIQSRAESGDITQESAPSHPSVQSNPEPGPAIQQATSLMPMLQTNPKPGDTIQNPAFKAPAIKSKSNMGLIFQGHKPITHRQDVPFTPEAEPESTADVPASSQTPAPPCEANRDVSAEEAVADWMIKMTHKTSPSGKGPHDIERHRRTARTRQSLTTPEGGGVRKRTASPGVGNHHNRKKRQLAKSDSLPGRGYQTRSHTARKDA